MPPLDTESRRIELDAGSIVDPLLVREIVSQVEKTLTTRRLYPPHMAPYREALDRLALKLETVLATGGFTLRVGRNELRLDEVTVFQREAAEDCWFFPLYRDGVRELVFRWPPSTPELESFLTVLESDRRGLIGPAEDTVVLLWRSDIEAISYSALDGLGDEEAEVGKGQDSGGPPDDFRALVQEVMEMIQAPGVPVTGQRYAFHLDADVRISASDLEYDPATVRRAFEEGPRIFPLTAEEVEGLRAVARAEGGAAVLERFVEILLSLIVDPRGVVPVERVAPVLETLVEGYWATGELRELASLTARLAEERLAASRPEAREALEQILQSSRAPGCVARVLEQMAAGDLAMDQALILLGPAEDLHWIPLLDFWAALPEGALHREVAGYLRSRLAFRPELLSEALASSETSRVHAALELLDHRVERLFAREVLALAHHPDVQVRLRAIAAAGRLRGEDGLELLCSALESDPAQPVRLLALRSLQGIDAPGVEARLLGLVSTPDFATRPEWERRRYLELLGEVAPEGARELFESWLPSGRLSWALRGGSASVSLALAGLACCGPQGLKRLRQLTRSGGRLGRLAAEALADALRNP